MPFKFHVLTRRGDWIKFSAVDHERVSPELSATKLEWLLDRARENKYIHYIEWNP